MAERSFFTQAELGALPKAGRIVIGLSAGADSMALVHFMVRNIDKQRILCAHLNHMLRGEEAERDQAAAERFCREQGVALVVQKTDVALLASKQHQGTEECGRDVRYRFFHALACEPEDCILTAHNADDNAETMLMNLTAGSGLDGICGIPAARGKVFRPFLRVPRSEIVAYCDTYGLAYVTDSTNLTDAYMRNRFRHRVIPQLVEANPAFLQAAGKLSETLTELKGFLNEAAEQLLSEAACPQGLRMDWLRAAHPAVRKAALKIYLIKNGGGRLSRMHIEEISAHLVNGKRMSVPGGMTAVCSKGVLSLEPTETPKVWEMEIEVGYNVLPCGKTLLVSEIDMSECPQNLKIHNLLFNSSIDCDTITKAFRARSRRKGDRFSPAKRNCTKSVKKLFGEMGIPSFLRDGQVLIEAGSEIAFIEGCGPSEAHCIRAETEHAYRFAFYENETCFGGRKDD